MNARTADHDLLRAVFDALPAAAYLVDDDARIALHNGVAARFGREPAEGEPTGIRAGEALHCREAEPDGCGRGPRCPECVIRRAVAAALTTGAVHRARARVTRRDGPGADERHLLVSAGPVEHADRRLAILTLEDVTEVVRLKSLLPVCSACRRIRDGADDWLPLEAYLKEQHDVDVSHGYCDACIEQLYPPDEADGGSGI